MPLPWSVLIHWFIGKNEPPHKHLNSCIRQDLLYAGNMKSILNVFLNKRMAVVLLTGFSCGIPLGLTGSTLQAWMKTENVDLTLIGLFSLVGLPYTFKFLWSPIMDRYVPPFLGRRRGWMIVMQLMLVLAIAAMAFSQPAANPGMLALLAVIVAFFSASQDIVVDAYRTEVLLPEELGPGASLYIMGYRIALLVSGALALILADHLPWKTVYLLMSTTMFIGVLATLFGPEPQVEAKPPKSLIDAVYLPFVEFFKRAGAIEILIFIILYKLDAVIASALGTPFLMELGFTKTDIAATYKVFGMIATIVGTLVGGTLMVRMGMLKSLWVFGIFQGVAGASFMVLARLGHNYMMMVGAIAAENFCSGMGTAAYSAFLMSLCDKRFTATQYALLTSLMAISRVVVGAPTGWLAKTVGWEQYFLISILVAIPSLLMLLRFKKWTMPGLQKSTS